MPQVKLGDVAVESRESYKGDKTGMPIVGLEHLTPGEVTLSSWDTNTENTFTKRFRKGDMLFGRRRAYLKKAAQAPFDGICSGDIAVIRAKEDILLPELLPFIIQNDNLFDFAVGKSAGSLSPRVKWDNLKNYTFELPTMDEQKKLAEVLWSINDTLQAYQKLLTETDVLVQAQFVEIFGDFSCEQNRWPVCTIGDIANTIDPHPSHRTPPIYDGGVPYIGIAECDYGTNTIKFEKARTVGPNILEEHKKRYTLSDGDFIIGKIGTIGKPFFIPSEQNYTLSANTVLIQPQKDKVNPIFLIEFFKSAYMDDIIDCEKKSTSQPAFGIQKVRKILMPNPPINLQTQFAELVQQINKSKFALQVTITSLQATKRCILETALDNRGKE